MLYVRRVRALGTLYRYGLLVDTGCWQRRSTPFLYCISISESVFVSDFSSDLQSYDYDSDSNTMANWHYYDENGDKITVSGKELKALAASGKITPGTMVESPEGKAAPAKRVKGLVFAEPPVPPPIESTTEPPLSDNEADDSQEKTSASPPEENVRPKLSVDVDVNFGGTSNANVNEESDLHESYKNDDTLESADMTEINAQYLYHDGNTFSFMDNETYEQYELSEEQINDSLEHLKEGMVCKMTLRNNNPVSITLPEVKKRPKLFVDTEINFGGTDNTKPDIETTVEDDLTLTTLHDAARANNPIAIARLLNAGADIKEQDGSKLDETALHVAAQENAIDAVNALIKAGAGIEVKTRLGYTPLYVATLNNAIHAVNALIEAGADIEAEGGTGWTPLHAGARFNSPESIVVLLKSGAVIEAKERKGRTPLHVAVFGNAVDAINVLIKAGANIESKDKDGMTPLHYAAGEEDAVDAVDVLVKAGANLETENKDGKTPLIIAIENNRTEAIELLCKADAKEDAVQPQDAEQNDWLQNAIRMIGKDNIDNPVQDGFTLLHLAVVKNYPEAIAQLSKMGAHVNVAVGGQTALHLAVVSGNVEVANALIKAGADIKAKNGNGNTPLDTAEKMNQPQIAELLRKAGAKESAVKTPDEERNDWLQKTIHAISKNDINNPVLGGLTLLHLAASSDTPEFIVELVNKSADIKVKDKDGNTALHIAASVNKQENIAKLVKMGAGTEAKNNQGMTPLHLAAMMGITDAITALLKMGANVEAKSSDGNTSLHLAALKGTTGSVAALLKAGANVYAETNKGATPLAIATTKKHTEVAELLRKAVEKDEVKKVESTPQTTQGTNTLLTPQVATFAPLIKRRKGAVEQIKNLEELKIDPHKHSFANYFNFEKGEGTPVGCGCTYLIIGFLALIFMFFLESLENLPSGSGFLLFLLFVGGFVPLGIKIKNHYETWKADRLSKIDSTLKEKKSELAKLNVELALYDKLPKEEREKIDAAILAEEKRQEKERQRQEEERKRQERERVRERERKESICPQCHKEWALSKTTETVSTHSEFRTEIKEEWTRTGREFDDGFYQKIPIQIQTVVTKEMDVTKCKYCSYRREGYTRENRREIR